MKVSAYTYFLGQFEEAKNEVDPGLDYILRDPSEDCIVPEDLPTGEVRVKGQCLWHAANPRSWNWQIGLNIYAAIVWL